MTSASAALRRGLFVAACALGFGFVGPQSGVAAEEAVAASGTPAPAADTLTVRTISEFWTLSNSIKSGPVPFDLECDVLFYDPGWKQLWVHDSSAGAYVLIGDKPLTVRAGQRIRATGTFASPGADPSFENATLTVVGSAGTPPVPLGTNFDRGATLSNELVEIEALVDRQQLSDPTHLRLFLCVEGRSFYAWVIVPPGTTPPDFTYRTVKVRGIYNPKLTPAGTLASLEIMVPGLDSVQVGDRLTEDPRFIRPLVRIEDLRHQPAGAMVRIAGEVHAQDAGHYVRIRDATGQADVLTAQTMPAALHGQVEAIGYPQISGTEWKLSSAIFRPLRDEAVRAADAPLVMRVAAQVHELSPEDAVRGQPVLLSGVVTWSHPDSPFLFLQDSSGGICVFRGTDPNKVRPPGRNVEVRGRTSMGDFAPVVIASEITKIGDVLLPEARPVSLEHALTGVEEAQWVEMRGYLRQVRVEHPWTRLEIATASGDFVALLPPSEDVAGLAGAVVRLRGVCTASANENRKLTGIQLWVPAASFLQVEEPAPQDVFGGSLRSIASLGRFATLQAFNRRVKVSGTVLHRSPGRFIIEEKGATLVALTRETLPLQAGERVEAVGFLGRQGARVVLRETVYRKTGRGELPAPRPIADLPAVVPDLDGQLAVVDGVLLDSAVIGSALHLTVQSKKSVFEAVLEGGVRSGGDLPWSLGARLELTGIYDVKYDEYGQPSSFALLLRAPSDIVVLESPSWFTTGRILALTGALGLGTLLFIVWVVALRRRVHQQTGQIRHQLQRETQLQGELERALRLESLGILAGGIAHDFNNLLTVVMGNVSLARLDQGIDSETNESLAEAERAVARARDLTQQLLTFAKGGAPVRSAVVVSDIVREVAQFVLRGSSVSCHFQIEEGLWAGDVDKGQVSQVVQNIVLNGAQAMPNGGRIDIRMRNHEVGPRDQSVLPPGRYLEVAISDHGRGIKAEDLPRIFDPYFTTKKQGSGLGLATVYSIVKRHGGHIVVESKYGEGTTFRVWLPAAAAAIDEKVETKPARPIASVSGRVLLMDDEESIRRLGATILRRAGMDVTATKDGSEAISEFLAAQKAGRPFDVLVFDLTVPGGMGGKQALEELLKLDPAVRAIVSSGYSNDPTLSDHRSLGFSGMVSKPYEVADLTHAVQAVMRGEKF